MEKFKCKYCGCETNMKVFVPFKETRREWVGDPKYTFHIKSICFNCHKFNGFLKQTDELIKELKDCTLMNLDIKKRETFNPPTDAPLSVK